MRNLIVSGYSIAVAKIWKHNEDVPTIKIDDLPDGISTDGLEMYLEQQQVDANSISMSNNGRTAYIELKRYSGKYMWCMQVMLSILI